MHKKTDLGNNLFFLDFGDGWSALERVDNGDYIDLHTTELANIPQVKALIEALEYAQHGDSFSEDSEFNFCPYCQQPDWQEHDDTCIIGNALSSFKCLPDDKETK